MKILAFIIVGISCGILFARYQLCAASAVRNLIAFRRKDKIILYACIIVASAILFNLFIGMGLLTETVKPFVPVTIVGGILFGIGMVIAGGSTEGILFRVGEGNVPAMICTVGMVMGMGAFGFRVASRFTSRPPHFVSGTLLNLLGIPPVVFSIVLIVLCILVLIYIRAESPARKGKLGLALVVAVIVALNAGMLRGMFFLNESDCQTISPLVLQEMIESDEDLVILDVRGKEMFNRNHLENSISLSDLPDGLEGMNEYRDKAVVVVCGVGLVSKLDCIKLNKGGFKRVYNLEGGLKNWRNFKKSQKQARQ